MFPHFPCFPAFPEISNVSSSKLAHVSHFCPYLIVELERDFLFVLKLLLGFDVALYLVMWSGGKDSCDRFFAGDFLLVSEHRRQEKEDGLISQLSVERVDSNSGAETRQGQKKEVGGETETATQPDAAVELEPKYSAE